MTPEAKPNPLSSRRASQPAPPHHMMRHAQIWQNVNALGPDEVGKKAEAANYVAPILGMLAGDPKVTPRDVIKASASAAADGKVTPAQAVKFISSMPTDPLKLRPWLKDLYEANMIAAVHLKAAMMKGAPAPSPVPAPTPGAAPPSSSAAP